MALFLIPSSILSCIFSTSSGTAMMIDGLKVRMSSPIVRRLDANWMLAPMRIGQMKLVLKEKAWKSGRMTKKDSSGLTKRRNILMAASASAQKLPFERIAPLGWPVVPEV